MIVRFSRIILFFGFLLAFQNAVAQTEPLTTVTDSVVSNPTDPTVYPKMTYGIRGGINFSRLHFNGGDLETRRQLNVDNKNHVRPQVGLVLNMALNRSVSIQPELLFNQKGRKNKGATSFSGQLNEIEPYKLQLFLNYIELPVLVKVRGPVYGDSLNFFFNIGPAVSFLINGSQRLTTEKDVVNEKIKFSGDASAFKRLEASVHAGAGFELLTTFGRLAVEGRYIYGLTNVIELNTEGGSEPKTYNRSIGLYLTYFLPDRAKK